ncbi:MAG TPA: hypothetical protein VF516_09390 [Kofleriaceae bacterium]
MTARGAAALVAVALAACTSRAPEHDGIGNWRFPHTRLQNIQEGRCQPTDLSDGRKATWCFAQPPIRIGQRSAEVDLYFLGGEPSAPLIEIQLKVRGCHEDELEQWLRAGFGLPMETRPQRAYWKNSFLWIGALMPSDPGRCLVHVLPLSENAEIDRIKQQ